MHIRAPAVVTANNFKTILPEFRQMAPNYTAQSVSLTDEYTPDEWVLFNKARETFSLELGGPAGFDRWIRGCLKIAPNEAYREFNSHRKAWDLMAFTRVY